MRTKYNAEKVSPTPSQESIVSQISVEDPCLGLADLGSKAPFMPKPFCTYSGHTSDLLDVSWSKNYFILSSSMDKTNGKFAVVGSYDGRCIFYLTDQLKYHTTIHVRSTRGKNATGRKISGIEPMPGEEKILITSNDSRIRLYDLRELNLSCKYKGYANFSSQIKASFSHDGKFIVSGSENQCIYIWKSNHDYAKFSSVRRDRNDYWEGRLSYFMIFGLG
ncbi:unnamed protein product [Nesidiocoris tenuis]|uniref:WD repeat-containing protein 44 n=1 Tax=Nesidiocoris tenuis TaxID=355587 RepID=A0A6H5GFU7_9HEMI|nr:unnamed protein product [Nesidiocoris tenuis]